MGDKYSIGDIKKIEILKEKFNLTAIQVDLTNINIKEQY